MMNYIIYLRKSQKDNPDESIEDVLRKHEIQLQEYALDTLGYNIPEEFIYREVVSGETIEARTEIKKVLSLIEKPNIKGVIVIEPQRLGRGDLQDCGFLVNAFRYSNTLILTPVKSYDLTDKFDRKFFEMELQRGNDYLEYYKEIQARGRLASVKRGNFIGSIPPYGYRKVTVTDTDGRKGYTLEPVPDEAEAVRLMYDMYVNQNTGLQSIAYSLDSLGYSPRNTNLWSPATIKDILSNPVYIGKIRWNWRKNVKIMKDGELICTRPKNALEDCIVVDGKHPAIIDIELYNLAISKQNNNPRVKSYVSVRNHFAGILYCECGRAMVLKPYYKKGTSGTKERASSRILCPNQHHCNNGSALYSLLQHEIVNILTGYLADIKITLTDENPNEDIINDTKIKQLQSRIEHLEAKELSLWDKYSEECMPQSVFQKLITKNEAALTAARKELNNTLAY